MTSSHCGVGLNAFAGILCSCAQAATPHYTLWAKSIDCGSFIAKAVTSVTGGRGFEQGRTQVITLTNGGRNTTLDLQQHSSVERSLHGRSGLDALAWEWRCFRSQPGRDYLLVDFRCVNEDATTCPSAMDTPGTEWSQAYSSAGRGLIHDARAGTASSDESRLRALGVWSALWQGTSYEETRFIYADDPGADSHKRAQ